MFSSHPSSPSCRPQSSLASSLEWVKSCCSYKGQLPPPHKAKTTAEIKQNREGREETLCYWRFRPKSHPACYFRAPTSAAMLLPVSSLVLSPGPAWRWGQVMEHTGAQRGVTCTGPKCPSSVASVSQGQAPARSSDSQQLQQRLSSDSAST